MRMRGLQRSDEDLMPAMNRHSRFDERRFGLRETHQHHAVGDLMVNVKRVVPI